MILKSNENYHIYLLFSIEPCSPVRHKKTFVNGLLRIPFTFEEFKMQNLIFPSIQKGKTSQK